MKQERMKFQIVGASLRMKCETIGTVSFSAIAVDKIAVEIRAVFRDREFIFIFFFWGFCFCCDMILTGTYLVPVSV